MSRTKEPEKPSPELLTYEQAAEKFRVSTRTIRRWVARRKLAAVKMSGNTRRIRPIDMARAIERSTSFAL